MIYFIPGFQGVKAANPGDSPNRDIFPTLRVVVRFVIEGVVSPFCIKRYEDIAGLRR